MTLGDQSSQKILNKTQTVNAKVNKTMVAKKKPQNINVTSVQPFQKLKTLKIGVIDLTTNKVNARATQSLYSTHSDKNSSIKSLNSRTPQMRVTS